MPCSQPSLVQPLLDHLSLDHSLVADLPGMPFQYVGVLQGLSDNKVGPSYLFFFIHSSYSGSLRPTYRVVP